MSKATCCGCNLRQTVVILAVVLGLVLGGILVRRMIHRVPVPAVSQARVAERAANLQKHREAVAADVSTYGVVNAEQGIYRVPVERAMELVVREWQHPQAAHLELTNRVGKAIIPPPPPPAKPNPFE
jgi:hypothetical protein